MTRHPVMDCFAASQVAAEDHATGQTDDDRTVSRMELAIRGVQTLSCVPHRQASPRSWHTWALTGIERPWGVVGGAHPQPTSCAHDVWHSRPARMTGA